MAKKRGAAAFSGSTIYTLAQTGSTNVYKKGKIIQGCGSELGNDNVIKNKAKRKMIGQNLALVLVDISRKKGDPDMEKAFWNTYYCQSNIVGYDGRTYGKYCKNRHCPLCCSIRKAKLINQYLPVIQQWDDPHFVTLTTKSVKARNLRKRMQDMIRGFGIITTKYRKEKGLEKLVGIRTLECCYNPDRKTYNPHFHLLVPDKYTAETIVGEWLNLVTSKFALRKCQDMRPVGKLENDLIETIKYGAKIINEPDKDKTMQACVNPTIYAAALYNIYDSMKGLRLIERFGFNLPKANIKDTSGRLVMDYDEWVFVPQFHDWLGVDNEQLLSSYNPTPDLVDLLKNRIDKEGE